MVKNPKAKGQRNERKAEDFLENHGYLVERQNNQRFSNNDYFNKFDILAIPRPLYNSGGKNIFGQRRSNPLLVQVKSNIATGIQDTGEWIRSRSLTDIDTRFFYMIWHDREGWRIIEYINTTWTVILDDR